MARKKRKRGWRKHSGLSGVDHAKPNSYGQTAKETTLMLLAAIAAGGAGAALGKHSLVIGLPVTIIGIHKKNKYITAAGLGFTLSNGFQKKSGESITGTDGFGDINEITTQAKERVTTFFKNFGEKLYLPKSVTEGTGGLGNDEVTYFVNPYSTKELDMTAIDRIQAQIAEMNKGTSGLNEIEREF